MNRIDRIFRDMKATGSKGLMPFVCAGYPVGADLGDVLVAVDEAGADVIEIGIPFSDPIADGPVISAAMHEALEGGMTPEQVFAAVRRVRDRVSCGLVAMVSVSIVHRLGAGEFVRQAASAGIDGLIVPDLPIEESLKTGGIFEAASDAGLVTSVLISPTTCQERLQRLLQRCTGFAYLLARVGLTGERDTAPEIEAHVARVRALTDLPIACGFGISSGLQVQSVCRHADAAIVGSALVRRMNGSADQAIASAASFCRELRQGAGERDDNTADHGAWRTRHPVNISI